MEYLEKGYNIHYISLRVNVKKIISIKIAVCKTVMSICTYTLLNGNVQH